MTLQGQRGLANNPMLAIDLLILQPWWKTWYAWMFYFASFVTLAYFAIRFFWLKGVFHKEKKLQQGKLDFFTNISYEIRKRLSLINGPVEQLLKSGIEDGEEKRQLNTIKSNSDSLLGLVNELMDPGYTTAPPASKTGSALVQNENARKYTILLVEDNDELRSYIGEALRGQYHVIEANNGATGWDLGVKHIPDLVISDVMMAEMNGLELCRRIKSDIRTSHVPVILLTAKATVPHQLEGLESGADLYITKPFSIQVLELNIKNLFHATEIMQQKFSRQIMVGAKTIKTSNHEEEFLSKIISFVEENMEDKTVGVSELASYIGMSKSVLYKKLRAVTDMTINDFVKTVRLQRAAQLLLERHFTVNEIAYRVGYSDRKYFGKEFKKLFGKTPGEYALEK